MKKILNGLALVFQPFFKLETVDKIDQNGKGLAFSFCSIFAIFQISKNGLKRPNTTLVLVENNSKGFTAYFWTVLQRWKTDQNRPKWKGVSLYFLLDFCHFFNIFKTVQKSLKPRKELLQMILKGLPFLFEPFLKRWKSGHNRPKW